MDVYVYKFSTNLVKQKKPDFGQMVRYINFVRHTCVLPKWLCYSVFTPATSRSCYHCHLHQHPLFWDTGCVDDCIVSFLWFLSPCGRWRKHFFFICLFAIWTLTTGEVSVQISCPHFNCVWCLLILEFYEIFVSLGYWSFIRYVFCKYFFFLVCNLFLCVLSFIFCKF